MTLRRRLLVFLASLAALGCQPRDETPGLWLRGEIALEQAEDWGFARYVKEIFIET